jgi:hypothetical protein
VGHQDSKKRNTKDTKDTKDAKDAKNTKNVAASVFVRFVNGSPLRSGRDDGSELNA